MTAFQAILAETEIQVGGTLSDILPGTTRTFAITVTDAGGVAVDISADTMTLRIKRRKTDDDADALLTKAAGSMLATGIATFSLLPTDTDLVPGSYYADIEWVTDPGAIYIVYGKEIRVLERVSNA